MLQENTIHNVGSIIIREKTFSFLDKQRATLRRDAFNSKNKCRTCGQKTDIHIHHLYAYAPKDIIDTYEDFLMIPWIPLCANCHRREHSIEDKEVIEDD